MIQVSDMIGALEIAARKTVFDDSVLEQASAVIAAGPTSGNAGCKNSVFVCIGSDDGALERSCGASAAAPTTPPGGCLSGLRC